MKNGKLVPLTPKTFDLLFLLTEHAGELVTRENIWRTVWPHAQVEDANLTNAIASLRRVLGKKALLTRPKLGYELTLPLTSRPGESPEISALLEEANGLLRLRSPQALMKARSIYWICLAKAPHLPTAWAWLGRCCRFLAKYGADEGDSIQLAEAAFQRALQLQSDLACAHEFYAFLQADQGRAPEAMVRLIAHTRTRPYEARSFSALVHVLRFCGLLPESLAAYRRVLDLDDTLQTSVQHTLFNLCDYAGVLDAFSGVTQAHARGYLDLAAWAAFGNEQRAAALASERLSTNPMPPLLRTLVESLLATLAGDREKVGTTVPCLPIPNDPEATLYFARHLSRSGFVDRALDLLKPVVASGYGCSHMLTHDPWFSHLRQQDEFSRMREVAVAAEKKTRRAFRAAGGDILLPALTKPGDSHLRLQTTRIPTR